MSNVMLGMGKERERALVLMQLASHILCYVATSLVQCTYTLTDVPPLSLPVVLVSH